MSDEKNLGRDILDADAAANECRSWATTPEALAYHDERWCKPVHDDRELFALLCLEGKQAGLSWSLIMRREAGIREAFAEFDPAVVAAYDEEDFARLKDDPRIIRNGAKIRAVTTNAQAFLRVVEEFGSFDSYVWGFVDGHQIVNHWTTLAEVPAESDLSRRVSRDLRRRGFKFVGPVCVYSYLQAIGILNDHLEGCPYK